MTTNSVESFLERCKSAIDAQNGPNALLLLEYALPYIRKAVPKENSTDFPNFAVIRETAVSAYHKHFPGSPKVRAFTTGRNAHLRARCLESEERRKPEWWAKFFLDAARSDFLTGRVTDGRCWRPDFDFFLQPKSFIRVIEGFYHKSNRPSANSVIESIQHEQRQRGLGWPWPPK